MQSSHSSRTRLRQSLVVAFEDCDIFLPSIRLEHDLFIHCVKKEKKRKEKKRGKKNVMLFAQCNVLVTNRIMTKKISKAEA